MATTAVSFAPGPGAYNSENKFTAIGSGPAATIKGRYPTKINSESPGPGGYSPTDSSSPKAPAFSISGRTPLKVPGEDIPGPGSYSLNHSLTGPSFSLSGRTETKLSDESPGPGAYAAFPDASVQTKSPSYSMGTRSPLKPLFVDTPGPGAYAHLDHVGSGPSVTITGRQPEKKFSESPGPGAYAVPTEIGKAPSISMSGRTTLKEPLTETPGPGVYNYTAEVSRGPAYTMSGRPPTRDNSASVPGPGAYEQKVEAVRSTSPSFSMSRRTPLREPMTETPGPGAYADASVAVTSVGTSAPSFSIGGRTTLKESRAETPGPGAYTQPTDPSLSRGPAWSMRDARGDTPGPGAYSMPVAVGQGPSITMSSKQPIKEHNLFTPGPGAYAIPTDVGKAPAVSISGRSPIKEPRAETPGPGAYELKTSEAVRASTPAFSMSGRPKSRDYSDTPGPGAYENKAEQLLRSAPAVSITSRRNIKEPNVDTPGPGAYPIDTDIGSAPSFSMSSRSPTKEPTTDTPGPGAYVSEVQQSKGPAFTMGTRASVKEPAVDTPGPGAYEALPHIQSGPSISISPKTKLSSPLENTPGPGAYSTASDVGKAPAFSIAQRLQPKDIGTFTPGPGAYDHKLDSKGPSAVIVGRPPIKLSSDTPPPGAYDHDVHLKGPSSPAFSMSGRIPLKDNSFTPGPGAYNHKTDVGTGTAASISGRTAIKLSEDTPGPGHYSTENHKPGRSGPSYSMGGKRSIFHRNRVEFEKPILTQTDGAAFTAELGTAEFLPTPTITIPEDLYEKYFTPYRHYNFLASFPDKEGKDESIVISVLADPDSTGKYRAVRNTKKGMEEFFIEEAALEKVAPRKPGTNIVAENGLKYLQAQSPEMKIHQVKDPKFSADIISIEKKHPQDFNKQLKVSIVYSKPNQKSVTDMFTNTSGSDTFNEFLNILAQKINLDGWTGYRGDMGKSGETYFTKWKDFEFMFHVSTMMNAEGHRRLIGNDIAAIFFQEDTPFETVNIDKLGTVPQVFTIVQPVVKDKTTGFRIAQINRINVKPVPPDLPKNWIFDKTNLKDFILTKLANSYIKARHSPPMNRLYYVPRAATIAEVAQKYPPETKKDQEQREKRDAAERLQLRQNLSALADSKKRTLVVKIIEGRHLISKDFNGFSDPYCLAMVGRDQQWKTKTIKKSLDPRWDEELIFDLTGVDLVNDDLEIEVWDWDRFGSHDGMGHATVPLYKLKDYLDKESWLPIHPLDAEKVSGEICVKITETMMESSQVPVAKATAENPGTDK